MVSATPEVGHRLADRYRLVECIEKADGYSTWHASDEKLARPVGIHILDPSSELAESVAEMKAFTSAVSFSRDGLWMYIMWPDSK